MIKQSSHKHSSVIKAGTLFLAVSFCAFANAGELDPLVLKDQGSLAAGGTVITRPGTFDPYNPMKSDGQTYHGDHVYAFYQIPVNARPLPIVMWHGDSMQWREAFVRTFLERDLPQLGTRTSAPTLRRFGTMLAHYHGRQWNASELARALGADYKTAQHYLDVLTSTLVVRTLQRYFANVKKRQVKSPKTYISDSGLLHPLLGLTDRHHLEGHPKVGASWEGFIIEQLCTHLHVRPQDAYFWGAHAGPEIDLVLNLNGRLHGFGQVGFLVPILAQQCLRFDQCHAERFALSCLVDPDHRCKTDQEQQYGRRHERLAAA